MSDRTLPVFFGDTPVGEVRVAGGETQFRYAETWQQSRNAFPVSLSMPLVHDTWGPDLTLPWLMNLMPEGEPLRAMARALGIATEDVLALIAASGRDLAGALSFSKPSEAPDYVAIIDAGALERILNELPARPFLVGEDGVSMSLAGAQDKLPVHYANETLSIPVGGAASTHILKPDNPRLPGSVQNEALCMVLARRCGLLVAEVTTGVAGRRSYILVSRYDRILSNEGVRRIHQEDFCQALGRTPAAKYQHNGTGRQGPSLVNMFTLIREYMTARDTNRFLDAVIFNLGIGNVDSHAKNYSILLQPGQAKLAPLYDLMSGLAWNGITENHSQDIGGQRRGRYVFRRHWQTMAEAAGLSATATIRRVATISDAVIANIQAARVEVASMPAGEGVLLDEFVRQITERARTVSRNLEQDIREAEQEEPGDGHGRYER